MMVSIHLGLPKTATTTLQNFVFPQFANVSFFGKSHHSSIDQSIRDDLVKCWRQFLDGYEYERDLNLWTKSVRTELSKNILISDDMFMEWPSPRIPEAARWVTNVKTELDVPRCGTPPIVQFTSALRQLLAPDITLQGILTLRNQTDYLGSLAAQTGQSDPNFLEQLFTSIDPSLKFFGIVSGLQESLGREHFLPLFYEDGVETNARKVSKFIGATLSEKAFDSTSKLNVKRVRHGVWTTAPKHPRFISSLYQNLNKSKVGKSSLSFLRNNAQWTVGLLPKKRELISISPSQRNFIQDCFKEDNEQLGKLVNRDLVRLGYLTRSVR